MIANAKRLLGRLRVQFTLYIALLLVAFTVLVLAFNWRGQTEIAIDRLQAHVEYVATLTARIAADRISEGDGFGLPQIVEDIVELEESIAITLTDLDGNVIVSAMGAEAVEAEASLALDHAEVADDRIHADAEIVLDGERMGVVRVVRSIQTGATTLGGAILGGVAAEEFSSVREVLVRNALIALTVFLFAIPIAALMVWRVTRGMTAVTEAAGKVAAGDLDAELPKTGTGEVADLQAAFRTMQSRLRNSIKGMETLAYTDTITRLPNRSGFQRRLESVVENGSRHGGALMMIDLDHFQGINDTLGHTFGDEVLRAVAARIEAVLATSAAERWIGEWSLARFGGDEFVILLVGDITDDSFAALAEAVIRSMDDALRIGETRVHIGCSLGATRFRHGQPCDEIVQRADLATYAAKRSGRRAARFFTPEIGVAARRRAELENELRQAINLGSLAVHFQPVISTASGAIVGAEALVRWPHATEGFVAPGEFIPIAEESGLIAEIGEFVLEESLRCFRELAHPTRPLTLSVNIAPAQLQQEGFAEKVAGALDRNALPPECLELELTETSAILMSDDPGRPMQRLRDLGIRFAIDDFGTGHSHLIRLPQLKFDRLKIDRSFIDGVAGNGDNQKIVAAITTLARSLGLAIVAEGVEREQDYEFVRDLGIEFAQGFLWCPALPFAEFAALVRALRGESEAAEPPRAVQPA